MQNPPQPPETEPQSSGQVIHSSPPPTVLVLVLLLATIGTIKAVQSLRTDKTGSNALYFLGAAALVLVIDRLKEVERTKDGGWRIALNDAIKKEVQKTISREVKPQLKEIGNLVASAAAPPSSADLDALIRNFRPPAPMPPAAVPIVTYPEAPPPAPLPTPPPQLEPGAGPRPGDDLVALPPPTVPNDPQKGRFGGKPQRNGRCLTAFLDEAPTNSRFYQVHLQVARVDPTTEPLEGSVIFHLHDTFKPWIQSAEVKDGVARLSLLSFGAFTVGAIADGGATLLELDLAEDTRFPENFRNS